MRSRVASNVPPLQPGHTPPQNAIWCGLYVASKHDDALYGTQAAIEFGKNAVLPYGAKIAWEIPLTFMGGDNRAFVQITKSGDLRSFVSKALEADVTENGDSVGSTTMRTAINSTSGGLGYMVSIISEPLPTTA